MKTQYKWLGDNLGLGSDSATITLQNTATRAILYISSEDIHTYFSRMDAYSKMRIEGGLQAEIKAASIHAPAPQCCSERPDVYSATVGDKDPNEGFFTTYFQQMRELEQATGALKGGAA